MGICDSSQSKKEKKALKQMSHNSTRQIPTMSQANQQNVMMQQEQPKAYGAPQQQDQTPYYNQYQQAYNYQNQDFNNYQMMPQPFPQQKIQSHAEAIFIQFDADRSGDIDMMEFPRMITAFYKQQGLQKPDNQTINYLMATFDYDRNGRLSWAEWNAMLQQIGGHHQMPMVDMNNFKKKNKSNMKGYKYHDKKAYKYKAMKFGFKGFFKGMSYKGGSYKGGWKGGKGYKFSMKF